MRCISEFRWGQVSWNKISPCARTVCQQLEELKLPGIAAGSHSSLARTPTSTMKSLLCRMPLPFLARGLQRLLTYASSCRALGVSFRLIQCYPNKDTGTTTAASPPSTGSGPTALPALAGVLRWGLVTREVILMGSPAAWDTDLSPGLSPLPDHDRGTLAQTPAVFKRTKAPGLGTERETCEQRSEWALKRVPQVPWHGCVPHGECEPRRTNGIDPRLKSVCLGHGVFRHEVTSKFCVTGEAEGGQWLSNMKEQVGHQNWVITYPCDNCDSRTMNPTLKTPNAVLHAG